MFKLFHLEEKKNPKPESEHSFHNGYGSDSDPTLVNGFGFGFGYIVPYRVRIRVLPESDPNPTRLHPYIHGWNPCFGRKRFLLCMHTIHGIHMLLTDTITPCMLMCTLVHIVDVRATLLNFVMIEYMMLI